MSDNESDVAPKETYLVYRIKTVFEFTPGAIEKLIRAYKHKQSRQLIPVDCWFDPKLNVFVLWGDNDACYPAFQTFMDVLSSDIKDAVATFRFADKVDAPIKRNAFSQLNLGAVQWTEDVSDGDSDDEDALSGSIFSLGPWQGLPISDVKHKHEEIWDPKISSMDFSHVLHPIDGYSFLDEITKITGCTLYPDWDGKVVKIGAESPASIRVAIKKLRKILGRYNRGFESIEVILVNPDEKKKFEIRLVSLERQGELNRTTLYSFGARWAETPADNKFLIRMAEYFPDTGKFVNCKIEPHSLHDRFGRLENPVRRWARSLESRGIADGNGSLSSVSPTFSPTLVSKRRKAFLQEPVMSRSDENLTSQEFNEPDFSFDSHFGSSSPAQQKIGAKPPVHLTVRTVRTAKGVAPSPEQDKELEPIILGNSVQLGGERAVSEESRPAPAANRRGPFSFEGSFSGIQKPPPTVLSTTRTTRKPRAKKSDTATPETEEKIFHRTMNQRAPGRTSKDSRPDLDNGVDDSKGVMRYNVQQVQKVFKSCFAHIRGWRGHIKFEASLGRIVLTGVPKSMYRRGIDWNEWEPAVAGASEVKTFFTDAVTREAYDIEHVLDLKLSKTENMFSKDLKSETITYEFHCTVGGKNRIFVMDATTFDVTCYNDVNNFGTIYWAYPTRAWDARIRLAGCKVLDPETPGFEEFIESISVRGGNKAPETSFDVKGSQFDVHKVQYRHILRYQVHSSVCLGHDIDLAVTELQDLHVHRHRSTLKRYKAASSSRAAMAADGRLSFSFALIPVEIEKYLKQNYNLEVAEDVNWTTDELIGEKTGDGILKALVNAVNTFIKKTDDVGFDNNSKPYQAE